MNESRDGNAANVCTQTVTRNLCIGCGVCAGVCPAGNLAMEWTPEGLLQPVDHGRCSPGCHLCLEVCPFQDHPADENALAAARFGNIPGIGVTPQAGFCLESFVGHVGHGDFRCRGASGGLASWFLCRLLHQNLVDRVICVVPTDDPDRRFRFTVCATADEVRAGAKSAYYPVDLADVLQLVNREETRYAIVGLPCFLKGVARAMERQPRLRERIVVMAGLVCGQFKSRGFTEYLLRHLGAAPKDCQDVSFRNKLPEKRSSDYFFQASTTDGPRTLPWSGVYGSTWLSGQFKPRACDFCDDTFAEVADIAFMDAWLPEYLADGRGASIALARSELAARVLHEGLAEGELVLQPMSIERTIASQAGIVQQKRQKLAWRLWLADRRGTPRPHKRVQPVRPPLRQQLMIQAFEQLRAASHAGMAEQKQLSPTGLAHYHRRTAPAQRRLALCLALGTGAQSVRVVLKRIARAIISMRKR
jgi:coenzyme F420 hydrogenase subunit beta